MITLYYSATPNGQKILLFLYETAVAHRVVPVSLSKGEQHKPEFLKISPNSKIPAIVDDEPADGGLPLPVFESAAILHYLADKTGRFIPTDPRSRLEVLEWLCCSPLLRLTGTTRCASAVSYRNSRIFCPFGVAE